MMNRIRFGLIAGLIFGILDILPMFLMVFSDRTTAIIGAFLRDQGVVFWPESPRLLPGKTEQSCGESMG